MDTPLSATIGPRASPLAKLNFDFYLEIWRLLLQRYGHLRDVVRPCREMRGGPSQEEAPCTDSLRMPDSGLRDTVSLASSGTCRDAGCRGRLAAREKRDSGSRALLYSRDSPRISTTVSRVRSGISRDCTRSCRPASLWGPRGCGRRAGGLQANERRCDLSVWTLHGRRQDDVRGRGAARQEKQVAWYGGKRNNEKKRAPPIRA